MNDIGPSRSPLPRAAPILAIGVAFVLVGGFGLGVYVLRKPVAADRPAATASLRQTAETILPEATPLRQPEAPPAPSRPDRPSPAPTPQAPQTAEPPPPVPAVSETAPNPGSPPGHGVKPAPAAQTHRPAPPAGLAVRPKPAAAPRAAAPARRKATASPAAAGPRKSLPVPMDGGRWGVRLGAFQSDDHAKLLVETLVFHGHPAEIVQGRDKNGRNWFLVQTPGYRMRADAEAVAKVLAAREHVPTVIFERGKEPGG
jgi:hypothetical protein